MGFLKFGVENLGVRISFNSSCTNVVDQTDFMLSPTFSEFHGRFVSFC